jgi:hypothetical protein
MGSDGADTVTAPAAPPPGAELSPAEAAGGGSVPAEAVVTVVEVIDRFWLLGGLF